MPIKESWLESGTVYGYRKVHTDLREAGEGCGPNRVHKIMKANDIRSQAGYGKRKWKRDEIRLGYQSGATESNVRAGYRD